MSPMRSPTPLTTVAHGVPPIPRAPMVSPVTRRHCRTLATSATFRPSGDGVAYYRHSLPMGGLAAAVGRAVVVFAGVDGGRGANCDDEGGTNGIVYVGVIGWAAGTAQDGSVTGARFPADEAFPVSPDPVQAPTPCAKRKRSLLRANVTDVRVASSSSSALLSSLTFAGREGDIDDERRRVGVVSVQQQQEEEEERRRSGRG